MILTKDNYHTVANTAISNSKVGTFLLSKELYYMKYVTGEFKQETTPSMMLGKLVDQVIENGSIKWFKDNYSVAVRKKDDAELFEAQKTMDKSHILTPDVYARIIRMCDKIFRSPFFDQYVDNTNTEFQKPLQMTKDGINICGLADVITRDKDTIYIDDLKTSNASAMKDATRWAWHCSDMGYLRQLAVYGAMVEEANPEISNIVYRHFVVGSSKSANFPIKLFIIPEELLKGQFENFMEIAKKITEEKEWIDKLPGWEDAEELPLILEPQGQGLEDEDGNIMQEI